MSLGHCIRCGERVAYRRYVDGQGPYCLDCYEATSQPYRTTFFQWIRQLVRGDE